jgi:competence protein ComGC
MNINTNNESGYLLTELLMTLVITGAIMAIAIPRISNIAKRISTKYEMQLVKDAALLYEADTGALPVNLAALVPNYFTAGSGQDKDSWNVNYTYNTGTRTLCSTSFSPSFCITF